MSVFSSLFSRDPKAHFAYDLPSVSFTSSNGILIGTSFKKTDPAEKATCFWASTGDYNGTSSLKAQAQKLKTMRHPNILTYLDSVEVDGSFYLITECCTPLPLYIKETKFTGSQKELTTSWGFFQLMNSLKFLHNEAKLSHESIRRSVYVTEGGSWKLGGFDKSVSFSNPRNDLNAIAFLLWEVFNGFDDNATKPGPPGKMPRQLHEFYKKCVTSQAAKLNAADLISDFRKPGGIFKNRFVDTLLFLDEFELKDPHDKQIFFSRLKDELDLFPDNVAIWKILPKLIQAYEYGDAGSHILLPLFKLGKLLNEDEYQKRIVPCLCKLFDSPDRATRVKLLEKIDEFAPHLTSQIVNDKIYGNLACGFLDTNPAVREGTVKAMVPLAEKLNYHNLNTDLMKYLARLQGSDDQPGIRTNTTICLGKIGCYIDPSQRQRILTSAFTRAMKDPFPPARIAAILALSATQQYYSLIDVATKVLPALTPLTCDPEKQVRDQSFKALRGFLEKLEKASENPEMIPELEAQVCAGGKSGLLSSDKVPQWASWALKSLSGKFYKATPPPPSGNVAVIKSQKEDSIVSSRSTTPPVEKTLSKVSNGSKNFDTGSNDGWDDLHDDFEEETPESEQKFGHSDDNRVVETDNWSDDWDGKTPAKTTPDPLPAKKIERFPSGVKTKPSHGGMKLQPTVKKPPIEDDLDFLLGITPDPRPRASSAKTESLSSNKSDKKTPRDLWSPAAESDSWGFSEKSEPTKNISSGWDADWDEDVIKATSEEDSRKTRRAEIAARNEARRKQLAAKRPAKGRGVIRLGATKPS